jgi:hypothetical protein
MTKLSKKDIRALVIGAVCAGAIVLFVFGTKWLGRWMAAEASLNANRKKLAALDISQAKLAGLMEVVPVFEMPQAEQKQKFLFRAKLAEQLQKAGIKNEPLEFLAVGKSGISPRYRLVRLRCRSDKCKLSNVLDLLAALQGNAYLLGVEEFKVECDPKKRKDFKLDMTVSTLAKSAGLAL